MVVRAQVVSVDIWRDDRDGLAFNKFLFIGRATSIRFCLKAENSFELVCYEPEGDLHQVASDDELALWRSLNFG